MFIFSNACDVESVGGAGCHAAHKVSNKGAAAG